MSLTPETIDQMREDYAAGCPVAVIVAKYKTQRRTLYHWIDGGRIVNGVSQLPPLPRRSGLPPLSGRWKLRGARTEVIARLWRAAEAQVRDIEERILKTTQQPVERERDARVLAVVARALRELSAFDDAAKPQPREVDIADDDDPRDLDEFRRELAHKIEKFIEARTGAAVPGDPEAERNPPVSA